MTRINGPEAAGDRPPSPGNKSQENGLVLPTPPTDASGDHPAVTPADLSTLEQADGETPVARRRLRNAFLRVWASVPEREPAPGSSGEESSASEGPTPSPPGTADSGSGRATPSCSSTSCSSSSSSCSSSPKTSRTPRRRLVAVSRSRDNGRTAACALSSFSSSSNCSSPSCSGPSSSPTTPRTFRRRSVAVSGCREGVKPGPQSPRKRESLRGADGGRARAGSLPLPSLVGLMLFRKLYVARLKRESAGLQTLEEFGEGDLESVEHVADANAQDVLSDDLLGMLEADLPQTPRFCSTLSPAAQLAMLQTYEDKLREAPAHPETGTDRQMALFEQTLERLLQHGQEEDGQSQVRTQLQASRLFEKAMHLLDDARKSGCFSQEEFDPTVFQMDRKARTHRPRVSFSVD